MAHRVCSQKGTIVLSDKVNLYAFARQRTASAVTQPTRRRGEGIS